MSYLSRGKVRQESNQETFKEVRGAFLPVPSERANQCGEQASAENRTRQHVPQGTCLDNRFHTGTHYIENKDRREFDSGNAIVKVHVEGSGVKVKLGRINRRKPKTESLKDLFEGCEYPDQRQGILDRIKDQRRKKRGKITSFSKAAALRLKERLSELRQTENPLFVDLTFPDEFPTPKRAHAFLKAFGQRVLRLFPGSGIFWKMEIKPRLSGENRGKPAPHFHLFIYGVPYKAFKKWSKRAWYEVVGSEDYWHRRKGLWCKEVYDLRGIKSYMKKYFRKEYEYESEEPIGRTWGYMGAVPWGEVREIIVDSKVAYDVIRILRKMETSKRKIIDKLSAKYKFRKVSKRKRLFDLANPKKILELVTNIELKYLPF